MPAIPTFVGAGGFVHSTGTITPPLPSGLQVDDILLAFFETHQETVTIPTPNGGTWLQVDGSPKGIGSVGSNSSTRITCFWSRYNGTQGNPTTNDPGDHISARILAFRGVQRVGTPWNVTGGSTGSTAAVSITGGTTTVNNCIIALGVATEDDGDSWTASWAAANLATIVQRTDNVHASGDEGHLTTVTGELATAGSFGPFTNTLSPSGQKWAGFWVALQPPDKVTLAASGVGVATLSRVRVFKRTLAALAVGAAAIARKLTLSKALAAVATGVAALSSTRFYQRALAATAVGVAALSTALTRVVSLAAAATGVSGLATTLSLKRTLTAIAVGVPTLAEAVTYRLALAAGAVGKVLLKAGTKIMVDLDAIAVGVAAISDKVSFKVALSAVGEGIAGVVASIGEFIAAITYVVGLRRRRR